MARRATAIARLREQTEGIVLVVDTGDTLFGKPPSDQSQGGLQIAVMNAMGYDAMALGEKDLGTDAPILNERFQEAQFPILSANVNVTDALPLQPYVLRSVDGHTVAIVGVTAVPAQKRAVVLGVPIELESPKAAISRTVADLRDRADIILVLSNLNQQANITLAREVPGIDAIIGARDVASVIQPQVVQGPAGKVVLHTPGQRGMYLGMLTLHFDAEGQVVDYEGQGLAITNEFANDPDLVELLRKYGLNP